MPSNIVAYSGPARPINDAYEGKPGFRSVRWNDDDGSLYAGYQRLANSELLGGCCIQVSPARQAALDVINQADATEQNRRATFIQSIKDLAVKVRDNTATAAEQRQYMYKLGRAVVGILQD